MTKELRVETMVQLLWEIHGSFVFLVSLIQQQPSHMHSILGEGIPQTKDDVENHKNLERYK